MEKREIGQSGIKASIIGLGTWAIGGDGWGGNTESDVLAAIEASLDEGMDFIDTAPIYGFGLAEELVGRAIAGRRSDVILATKCGLVWNETKGDFFFPSPHGPVHRFLGAKSIRWEVEESLRRLKTDYIDLYQTHWQETTTPIEESMAALIGLRDEGKIRAIGVSNVDESHLRRYVGTGPVASVQELYSMIDRDKELDVLNFCREHRIGFLAYSPLAMGLLTGKMKPGATFAAGDMRGASARFSPGAISAVNAFLDEIQPEAKKHGLTMAQLVINWTVNRPGISHVLCGARNAAQARENAGAVVTPLAETAHAFIMERLQAHDLKIPRLFS